MFSREDHPYQLQDVDRTPIMIERARQTCTELVEVSLPPSVSWLETDAAGVDQVFHA